MFGSTMTWAASLPAAPSCSSATLQRIRFCCLAASTYCRETTAAAAGAGAGAGAGDSLSKQRILQRKW